MKLIYNNEEIGLITTQTKEYMQNRTQKIYYAILIKNCNKYSSIYSKQYYDVIMIDDNNTITSFIYNMHPNTVFEDKKASQCVIVPNTTFTNYQENTKIEIK